MKGVSWPEEGDVRQILIAEERGSREEIRRGES